MRPPLTESEAVALGAAMRAERETRIAAGMRITYVPGPLDRGTPGLTTRSGDPPPYDGGWTCCDGVFCNTHPDTAWGRERVLDWVKQHLRIVDSKW